MKRAVVIVAVAALSVAGSAVAQDRSGLIGSGTRAEDSGGQLGSGNVAGQTLGSGGFTTSAQDQFMGSGGRTEDGGGTIGSGTRAEDSGASVTAQDGGYLIGGGYFGSGLSVRELRLWDGSSLLIVSSDEGVILIQIEE